MVNEIIKKFDELKGTIGYKRIDSNHPLDIYIGFDENGKKSFAIITDGEIDNVSSTKMIEVKFVKRTDERYNFSFSLIDSSMSDLFYIFCNDLISSSQNLKLISPLKFVIERWKSWLNLFQSPHSLILNENEIRGLLGELVFLKNRMFIKYGIEKSIASWIGVNKAHKDFEIDDTWYEVKTISQNAITVKISSIEQLDSNIDGTLVVVKLEPTNYSVNDHLQLNKLINSIYELIDDEILKNEFTNKLITVGYYYAEEYDKYIYSNKGIEYYLVDEKFPRLKKEELKDGIVRVSYELYLNNLKDFRVVGD